jgi:TPP-dependent pyruvate/acetoin dehydrogenase alpha subunit
MIALSTDRRVELWSWMQLTRSYDETLEAMWKQGRGLGGTFLQRGHEAISVGAGSCLTDVDVVAPMHRDVGCYFLRGMTPERILANHLGRATGVSGGRDANLHGCGDMNLNIIGFVSHLPQSLPVALGAAMSFQYRDEARVSLAFTGDGSSTTGLFHETLNIAAVQRAPFVLIVENNQYAYSTPLSQQMASTDIAAKARAHGVPAETIDGNDVEEVVAAVGTAFDRARMGGGPGLIEAKTMRMRGHAIHDGYEYVPEKLLAEWEALDPVRRYRSRLVEEGVLPEDVALQIEADAKATIRAAVEFAEQSPWPDPAAISDGVYAP